MEIRFLSCCILILMFAFSLIPILPPATGRPHNNFTDLESLLAFKAHVADPSGILAAGWTTNTSFCSWTGVLCRPRRQRVAAIHLLDIPLQGTISPHLGNLSFLSDLILSNNSLTGPIPATLGQLPRLNRIALQENFLSGQIPSTIFNMSSLIALYLMSNSLSGTIIPSNYSINMLPRIKNISIGLNHFSGEVPSCFAQCQNLELLYFDNNQFTGTIPVEIGRLPKLRYLFLGSNQLSGTIPASLGNLTKLRQLELYSNNLTGKIPEALGDLGNLQGLRLYHNSLIGSIPLALLNDSALNIFDLSENKLTGSVPAEIGKSLPQLSRFHVGSNQLSGGLEFLSSMSNCQNLNRLLIYKNTLEGVLPRFLGNLSSSLLTFDAFGNRLRGNIPTELGNLSNLIVLELSFNELTGTIPSALARFESLQYMWLGSNNISGLIPFELGLLKNLNRLGLNDNALDGPIPHSLANISRIQILSLKNNKLSSSIPQSLWTLESLLQLDLSGNTLNGSLPPQVGYLNALTYLNLSANRLSGNISSALGKLQMLNILDLSNNLFQGQIPQSFDKLIVIGYLNLSYNFLSGAIPQSLANLSHLVSLDLSFNKLQGQVPKGGVFANSNITSLKGNEALCGAPQLHLPPCYSNLVNDKSRRNLRSLKYILLATMLAVVLLSFLCLLYAFYMRRKPKTLADTTLTCLDDHRAVSHHELVRATANFSEENLLGRGGFGSVFKGCLDDGLIVAVKVLHLELEEASKSFDAECQVLKMVRHRNLIKIISVCSNLDFKALILEFMPNGSLEKWLYSENCFLDMLQRLNISVDVSLALEYLHHHHPHVVLHCDLKPTNILLDEELVVRVSDFGISKLLLGESKSMATASMPGTIGYIAPEYGTLGTVSRMGDVYSFGILLLETFTSRRPVDSMFFEQSSLREWIHRAYPTTILDVVDENLLKHHATKDGPNQDLTKVHQCLSSVIELGLLCSSYSPKERIPMTDVAERLQKIKMEYLST